MKEPKKEYWQDKASNMIIIFGGIIALLIPLLLNANLRGNFSSYNSDNSGSNNYEQNDEQRTNVIDSGVQKYQPIPDVVGLDYREARKKLIKAKWKPYFIEKNGTNNTLYSRTHSQEQYFVDQEYLELRFCAIASALIPCFFIFQDKYGNYLTIHTEGQVFPEENYYPSVSKWGLSRENPDIPNQNNSSSNIFDNESFPKDTCGDRMPTNINEFPVNFYPVYAEPTAGILQYIKVNLCRDAYSMTRKDIGQRATQVGSFTSYERAEQFSKFLQNKIGSGEVGQPRRVEKPPR